MHEARAGVASKDLGAIPPRDRHQPQADRSEPPHREASPSCCPGLSSLPRFVGLGRLCVDNKLPNAAVWLRPEPQEVPLPIPSRFALSLRRGLRLRAFQGETITPALLP